MVKQPRDKGVDYDPKPVDYDDDDAPSLDFLETPLADADSPQRHWYVVHCYSGQEKKVCQSIEQRINTMGMRDRIFDVIVPTEDEIEIKDGKRRTVEKRVFPGYILVEMIMDEEAWFIVRNTTGVTGFVGMGNDPTPPASRRGQDDHGSYVRWNPACARRFRHRAECAHHQRSIQRLPRHCCRNRS